MLECSPLLMTDGASWIELESGAQNLVILQESDDCSILFAPKVEEKKPGGGTVVPNSQYYTPIPERILWLKVRHKETAWEKEVNLKHDYLFVNNNAKVSAMFKHDILAHPLREVKVTIKTNVLLENIKVSVKKIGINTTNKGKKK